MTARRAKAKGPIDWDRVHRKLPALEPDSETTRTEISRVLAERALRLAQPGDTALDRGVMLEVLSFERRGRRYAIESRFVMEVGKCERLSRVPFALPQLLGMLNLRGDLLPVFELASMEQPAPATRTALGALLIVLGSTCADLGLLADSVSAVTELANSDLTGLEALGRTMPTDYVRGVTGDGCALLDGDAILLDRSRFVAKICVWSRAREGPL